VNGVEAYTAVVAYLRETGWLREEPGSGWWWKEGENDGTLGDALERQLDLDEVDQRDMIPHEPREFWPK
jgi:hypothetical protein